MAFIKDREPQLTLGIIKSLCDQASYKTGEAYYRAGKVTLTTYDPNSSLYNGRVQGNSNFDVQVRIDPNGHVEADCTCPTLDSYAKHCQHVAAVLLLIHEFQQDGFLGHDELTSPNKSGGDSQLTNRVLELFSENHAPPRHFLHIHDTRESLNVEFIFRAVPYADGKYLLGIEIKAGLKRLYMVKNIRDFLDRMEKGEGFVLSKNLHYDPLWHGFQRENEAVMQQLMKIYEHEKMVRELSNSASAGLAHGERMLIIPPSFIDVLLPLLAAAPKVQVEQEGRLWDGLQVIEEPLPLTFAFDQLDDEGCQLKVQGLERMTVMEAYGLVLVDGKLVKLPTDLSKRLSELKSMLESGDHPHIPIASEQIELFMEKVIPRLRKLGTIQIAPALTHRMVQTPLKAKLYLDRVKDRLLAGLEFQYGDVVINPLEARSQNKSRSRMLLRDGDQEQRILELMDRSAFTKTEEGYIMHDEEAEYDFLYHMVPELEKWVTVYATTAVKIRLVTGHASPKVTVKVTDRPNWLEIRFDMQGIAESDIQHLLQALEEKRKYYRLPNGALLPLESHEFQEIRSFIEEMGIHQGEIKGTKALLPVVRGVHLMEAKRQGKAVEFGKSFRMLLENLRHPDHRDFPVPHTLEPILREYQKYGFQWMKTLAHYRFGGILADDMGLGKTLQSIAFLLSELPDIREQKRPALIVSPASLVYNWQHELKKFAPEIRSVVVDGRGAERRRRVEEGSQVDVLITSYPLLRRDREAYSQSSFHTLILDEAQYVKNHHTQTAKAVKEIHAQYRFALTGTPIENRLEELWSIFDVVFPALFAGRKAFHGLSRERVAKTVRPFLLRRVKSDVLQELPEKMESIQVTELLAEQKKLYVAYLAQLQQETVKHLAKDFQKNRIKILAGLTRLRQLCCHPALFVEGYTGSSAKFEQLMEILAECQSAGKRVLVFSQFTEMLGLMGQELGNQGVPYFYLDGKTPVAERIERCNRFNLGERDVFLISLKAGGTGLNLTGADTVILYDLWWNPAVEQQAADRAHRIGQKKVVQVIRLVSQGTVEDKMYELQLKKKNLIEEVIHEGHQELAALSEQDIREILMI
ncbi:DEAD/DEAH box helicase [Ammoniphilus sp. CFH 90114]|uniref:DEAD/DEAH box helicase n=1 Tax=Ammoniphilus sp. CFH 90114 TaxID=2493665 RepID=UPI00100DBFD6|nr:DEAD/DEAH box helicase [Ammoniphilus sp. CFH 90114]RXT01943.1 helicase SNF [Ammoniphilus sp. CFH 90114]